MERRRRHYLLVLPFVVAACGSTQDDTTPAVERPEPPLTQPIVVSEVGFMTPESVLHDATADVYLVSNINGTPFDQDDNGFISRVSPTGEMLDLKWIDGAAEGVDLNAPKGMAIAGNLLYVSDITVIRMFDRETGEARGTVEVPGSTFLNDVAAGPDGTVYFTDSGFGPNFESSGTDAVYRLSGGTAERVVSGDDLARPNGIAIQSGAVWVVAFGANQMYRVDGGAKSETAELPGGSLDGLVLLPNGEALISSWETQSILHRTADGNTMPLVSNVEAPADIGYDSQRNRVLIPLFQANAIQIVQAN